MNKEGLIVLGIIGVSFMSIGAAVGMVVANKINDKHTNVSSNTWKETAMFFKDQLVHECEKNEVLRERLRTMEV